MLKRIFFIVLYLCLWASSSAADEFDRYISAKESSTKLTRIAQRDGWQEFELASLQWQGSQWKHRLLLYSPKVVENATQIFLFITGSGSPADEQSLVKEISDQTRIRGAVLTHVPNQPLFDGLKEDALIAFSLVKYLETGDATWPALLPMTKAVTIAMSALDELLDGQQRFILSGSSKRGWTTWLTASVDRRVSGIAPRVFDILNIPTQLQWAAKAYGRQSEKIKDYVKLGLVDRINEPRMQQLMRWIDPYSRRNSLTVPKLIMLGTNDPYWVVDASQHYWHSLSDPKHLFQAVNTGHSLKTRGIATLTAFINSIATNAPLPKITWSREKAKITFSTTPKPTKTTLWRTCSPTRDFRQSTWLASAIVSETLYLPQSSSGSCAFLLEFHYPPAFSLFSEAFVQ